MKIRFFLLLLLTFLLLSCAPDIGIFYSIESEELQEEGSLPGPADNPTDYPYNLTVHSMVSDPSGNFLLAASRLYAYSALKGNWIYIEDAENLPEGFDLALSAAYTDAYYVCFYSIDGSSYGLYSTSNPLADTISWSHISQPYGIVYVLSENGELFVITNISDIYSIYHKNGSVYDLLITDLVAAKTIDISYDGTNYWIVWGNDIYISSDLSTYSAVTVSTIVAGLDDPDFGGWYFGGILYDSETSTVYASANGEDYGTVWKYSGSDWVLVDEDLDYVHDLYRFVTPGGSSVLLLGSDDGYLEMTDDGFDSPSVSCSYSTYSGLDLEDAVVKSFYVSDTADTTLYALTINAGLWVNENGSWDWE